MLNDEGSFTQHPNCRSAVVLLPLPLPGRSMAETEALRYLWRRIQKGQQYVSITRMSQMLQIRYDLCETYIIKFHAERVIPRLVIMEEVEG